MHSDALIHNTYIIHTYAYIHVCIHTHTYRHTCVFCHDQVGVLLVSISSLEILNTSLLAVLKHSVHWHPWSLSCTVGYQIPFLLLPAPAMNPFSNSALPLSLCLYCQMQCLLLTISANSTLSEAFNTSRNLCTALIS